MNQPQPTMGTPKPAVSKWLWIILIVVVVAGAGFFSWYYLMGPGKKTETSTTTSTTTPTSTTSTPSSTSTTPSTTATTPSTSTSTNTSTEPPSGWKLDTNNTYQGKDVMVGSKYTVFIKNDWKVVLNYQDTIYNSAIYYGDNDKCGNYEHATPVQKPEFCVFFVAPSKTNNESSLNYFPISSGGYLYIKFTQADLSAADKKIILDSFKITE